MPTADVDVLDVIPPAESIRQKLLANRTEADALKKMLKIAVRRETARELRSRSAQTAGR